MKTTMKLPVLLGILLIETDFSHKQRSVTLQQILLSFLLNIITVLPD